jgi:hypothetical protein
MAGSDDLDALRALADGDLAAWPGLPAGLSPDRLAEALGPAGDEEAGRLAGQLATFRVFPPAVGAPFGVKAWLAGDEVWLLEVREPPLQAPLDQQLGDPEATAPSGLGTSYVQRVYGARGLLLHVSEVTGEVRRLYAFTPEPADAVLAGPIGRVEERRVPRGRL